MKKIFTIILAAAATIGSAYAQPNFQKNIAFNNHSKMINDHGQKDRYRYTNKMNYNDPYFSYKAKEAKLEMMNHEYDQKIDFVKHGRHLNGWAKSRQIQMLQNQLNNEIGKVELQFAKSNHKDISKTSGHDSHKW